MKSADPATQTRVQRLGVPAVLVLMLLVGGCASVERCNQISGLVYDVTALSISPKDELLAGGTYYELGNCAFEELVKQSGRRPPKGLLLAISKDKGKSWKAKKIPLDKTEALPSGYELRGLVASNVGALLAGINDLTWVGFSGSRDHHARLLKSDDDGSTWQLASDFGQDRLMGIVTASNSVILAALCNRGILRTQDNGTTWVPTGLRRADNNSCASIKLTSNSSGEIYAYAWGRNGPGFYRSADEGTTWSRLPIPMSGSRSKIATNDRGDIVVSMSGPWQHEMHLSNDHGKTWKKIIPPYEFWTDQLAVTHEGVILVKAMDNLLAPSGGSYISTDNGESWIRLNNRWTGENNIPGDDAIVADRSGTLFVKKQLDFNGLPSSWGWGGTIYHSDDSGRSWHTINPLVEHVRK